MCRGHFPGPLLYLTISREITEPTGFPDVPRRSRRRRVREKIAITIEIRSMTKRCLLSGSRWDRRCLTPSFFHFFVDPRARRATLDIAPAPDYISNFAEKNDQR